MDISELIVVLAVSTVAATAILYWTIRNAVAAALRSVNTDPTGQGARPGQLDPRE
ncbi:hypothetical protein QMG61_05175 [Cryobacterium sp. PH31-AA6]|uniref:hypothetical protein n=1 Tax=Cryobacterium sp. PH31-AA6 TaxID=3046205 RepID=UPI0024BA869B|nr:hypothetical protein [Cryobacterium sp. PH31-AA6]MDJ0323154.1 hypothetical protein [Cryobacterium sp. PH31-AA6]